MEIHVFLVVCIVLWCAGIPFVEMFISGVNGPKSISVFNLQYGKEQLPAQAKYVEEVGKWDYNIDHYKEKPVEKSTNESPKPLYDFFPGLGYYKLHTFAKDWNQAKLTCEKEGAHLAVINSQEEVEVVQELRRRLPRLQGDWRDDFVLVGINDVEIKDTWKTIFNETLEEAGFAVWDVGQPGTDEHCGCVDTKTGKLHDCG